MSIEILSNSCLHDSWILRGVDIVIRGCAGQAPDAVTNTPRLISSSVSPSPPALPGDSTNYQSTYL